MTTVETTTEPTVDVKMSSKEALMFEACKVMWTLQSRKTDSAKPLEKFLFKLLLHDPDVDEWYARLKDLSNAIEIGTKVPRDINFCKAWVLPRFGDVGNSVPAILARIRGLTVSAGQSDKIFANYCKHENAETSAAKCISLNRTQS